MFRQFASCTGAAETNSKVKLKPHSENSQLTGVSQWCVTLCVCGRCCCNAVTETLVSINPVFYSRVNPSIVAPEWNIAVAISSELYEKIKSMSRIIVT